MLLWRWRRGPGEDRRGLGWLVIGQTLLVIFFSPTFLTWIPAPAQFWSQYAPWPRRCRSSFMVAAIIVTALGQRLWGIDIAVNRVVVDLLLLLVLVLIYASIAIPVSILLPVPPTIAGAAGVAVSRDHARAGAPLGAAPRRRPGLRRGRRPRSAARAGWGRPAGNGRGTSWRRSSCGCARPCDLVRSRCARRTSTAPSCSCGESEGRTSRCPCRARAPWWAGCGPTHPGGSGGPAHATGAGADLRRAGGGAPAGVGEPRTGGGARPRARCRRRGTADGAARAAGRRRPRPRGERSTVGDGPWTAGC